MQEIKKISIIKSSFWSYLGIFILLFAGLITSILLARLLDAENWGIFSTLLAVVSFLSSISELGLNYYIIYTASKYADKGKEEVKKHLAVPLKYKLIFLFIIAALMLLFSNQLADLFHIENGGKYFAASAIYFFILNISSVFNGILDGLKRFKDESLVSVSNYVIRLILSVIFVAIGFGVDGAILGYIIAVAILTLIQFLMLKEYISFSSKERKTSEIDALSDMISYGFYFGLASIAATFSLWTDSVMLGIFVGTTSVGIYRIAVSLASATSSLLSGITKVMFPYFTSAEGRGEESLSQLNKVMKYSLFITIPAVFGIILSADGIVNVLFGKQYIDSTLPLIILSYLILDGIVTGLISSYLAAKKQTRIIGFSSLISAVINIILNLILIPLLGMIGAAITSVFSRIVNLFLLIDWSNKKLGKKYEFQFITPLLGSIIMAIFLFILRQFINPAESIFHLLFFIGFGIVVYLIFEQLLGFDVIGFAKKITKALIPDHLVKYIPISLD